MIDVNFVWLLELFGPKRGTDLCLGNDGRTVCFIDERARRFATKDEAELALLEVKPVEGHTWRAMEHGFCTPTKEQ